MGLLGVWAAEQRADHQEVVVGVLNLLAGLVALGIRAMGLPGLRSKAETVVDMVVLVAVVSLAVVGVETAQPLPILAVVVALGLPGEPLRLPIRGLEQHRL